MRINFLATAILVLSLSPLWAASNSDASFDKTETPTLILVLTIGFDQDQPSLTLTLMTCASDESLCTILFTMTISPDLVDITFPFEAFELDEEIEFLDQYQPFSVEGEPVSENPDGGP